MIAFERIGERDVDLVIMRAFSAIPEFSALFFEELGWRGATITHIEHSVMDHEFGESDVIIKALYGDIRCALLIENKIDANAQPEQYQRYVERGEKGLRSQEYDCFEVFITAPKAYLDTDPEAQKYPHQLSYETMLGFFEKQGAEFESEIIRTAIKKKEDGYTLLEVKPVTEFWQKLHFYINESAFTVSMNAPVGAKGSRSTTVPFKIPLAGAMLFFKARHGFVDLEFTGKECESTRLKKDLLEYLEDGMQWEETGASLSLRIKVKPIDFRLPFEQAVDEVNLMLSAVERLTTFAVRLNNRGYIL